MTDDIETLELTIKMLKADAYDVLAQLENINKQYKDVHTQLQRSLATINSQIADVVKQLDALQAKEEKAANQPAVATDAVLPPVKELLQE